MPGRGLIFLGFGLAVSVATGLFGAPHFSTAGQQPQLANGRASIDQLRLDLTAEQVAQSASTGLLPYETRSILDIDERMTYGDFAWNEQNVPPGKLLVRVDLRRQMISVFRGGHEIGTAIILYGADGHDTPIGKFPILAKFRDHRSSIYDAPMPFTLRLTADGIAIHGSDVRWGAATHGCVGVPTEFARRLFEEADVGDAVEIVSSSVSA